MLLFTISFTWVYYVKRVAPRKGALNQIKITAEKNSEEIGHSWRDQTYIPKVVFKAALIWDRCIDVVLPKQVLDREVERLHRLFEVEELSQGLPI